VSISLQDPEIPQEHKRVVITVSEQRSQYIEPRGGFSTGEGFRAAFEYGHRNIAGEAISLTLRLEFTLLPEFLILDEDVAKNYQDFTLSERLERRNSGTLRLPEIGLGPKVDLTVAAIDLRDNQRDFGLTRQALVPTLSYRPAMEVSLQLGTSVELNDVTLFGAEDVMAAIKAQPSLAGILRVPDGRTVAISQRLATTWDRRDNPLAATEGTLLTTALEHVSAFPMDDQTEITSEFLRLTARAAGYLRLSDNGIALALSVSGGLAIQLDPDSKTYPDRLFYLGGVNSVRGFQLDSMVPEDLAQSVLKGEIGSINEVGVRGGDLMLNPRVELRIPLTEELGLGIFVDAGNLWADLGSIEAFEDLIQLRYTIGGGVRVSTPIGPIAFDYGFKTVRREWEDLGALHFSIGLF
jgi:outer membrane protein insertion porin family